MIDFRSLSFEYRLLTTQNNKKERRSRSSSSCCQSFSSLLCPVLLLITSQRYLGAGEKTGLMPFLEAISKVFPDFGPRKNKDKPPLKMALVSGRVSVVSKTAEGAAGENGDGLPVNGLMQPPRAKRYRLNEFAVRELIGRGAFSEVSLARHIFEEQHYALKTYKKSEIASSTKILRLVSEIEILRLIKHPFILPLKATFQDPRRMYLMFDFCQGGELFYHLRNYGTFNEDFIR